MKPATAKVRALFGKLERLADPANGGTLGEIDAAKRNLRRLRRRFDFSAPAPAETIDIFSGIKRNRTLSRAVHVYTFQTADFDIANSVKWAIEQSTGIPCLFRGGDLLAAAAAGTANKLAKVALHIAQRFQTLLDQFGRLHGVTASDRRLFLRGLYDGMMNDSRGAGERLPGGCSSPRRGTKARKGSVALPPRVAIHPYTVALSLGKQIRFAAPMEEITAELERAVRAALGPGQPQ